MTLDIALQFTSILLGFAFVVQSAEHFKTEFWLYMPRIVLSVLLMLGLHTEIACVGLVISSILLLHRYNGPYNGGADRMGLLVLVCLTLAYLLPAAYAEIAFGYLALQLILSYFISGYVKIVNPEWRSCRALRDVFLYSGYPQSEQFRALEGKRELIFIASWAVILFELAFPFLLLGYGFLIAALVIAALFHLSNAIFFGLNRFFWVWISAYPSIIWFYGRVIEGGALL